LSVGTKPTKAPWQRECAGRRFPTPHLGKRACTAEIEVVIRIPVFDAGIRFKIRYIVPGICKKTPDGLRKAENQILTIITGVFGNVVEV